MRYQLLGIILLLAGIGSAARAQISQPGIVDHPQADELHRFFDAGQQRKAERTFKPTGLTRADYLKLIQTNVDFWKQHQDAAGAIIDPYEKKERQYSTPAFALASALLVIELKRDDLLEASTRAMSFATAALANKTSADNHADFYIPMLIHARRLLKERVPADVRATWDEQLRALVPQNVYRSHTGSGNWNLVNVSGECLRRKDGLVAPERRDAQLQYIESCLAGQQVDFTRFGMYQDPNSPIAYDAFPRLWLEDMLADGAYEGKFRDSIAAWLRVGSLSSLLLISPSGEWACGGRSAHHQWNEAETALICEIEANHWKRAGRVDVAGALKRAAHLSLQSMYRWRRPSGELWIVKNFADPSARFGYEGYSFHSQYNNLAMAMLAMAYLRADDSIEERPMPSEAGAYVFDVHDIFHKIVASAGGTYVEIDTGADPGYNATGIQRIHKSGVALSPLSDSAAGHRHYAPPLKEVAGVAMSPGIQWQAAPAKPNATSQPADDVWYSLADFNLAALEGRPRPYAPNVVLGADLRITERSDDRVSFVITYALDGEGARSIQEQYTVSGDGVQYVARLTGKDAPGRTRFMFPSLVNDGARDTEVKIDGNHLAIRRVGGALNCELLPPKQVAFKLDGPRVPCHNGWMQPAVADLPAGTREVRARISLLPDDSGMR